MNFIEEKVAKDGVVKDGNILIVDSFLNHQIDVDLLNQVGREFRRRFNDCKVTKILTIEASGIGIACMTAQYFGVPVLFAKKSRSLNVTGDKYSAKAYSYTHECENTVYVASRYLSSDDRVLIIDDFLAQGEAVKALCAIVAQAGASVEGIGIVVEKGFQEGGRILRESGFRLESLAVVDSMDAATGRIVFRKQEN